MKSLVGRAASAVTDVGQLCGTAMTRSETASIADDEDTHSLKTLGNQVTAIPDTATRATAIVGGTSTLRSGGDLCSPLGATMAPNGGRVVVNGRNGYAMKISRAGTHIAESLLVPNGAGTLSGVIAPWGSLQFVNHGADAPDAAATR